MVLVELIYYIGVRYIITDDDTLSSYEDVTEFYNTIEDKSNVELLDLTKYGHVDVLLLIPLMKIYLFLFLIF